MRFSRLFIIVFFVVTLILEVSNFKLIDFSLTNDEIRTRDERLSVYPADKLQIGYYLEQKREVIVARKIINNVIAEFDLNRYFFAGHPRERIGVDEYEKFPYILLPPFLVGVYEAVRKRKYIFSLFIIPIFVNALNANNSHTNNISILPFIAGAIYLGLVQSIKLASSFKYKNYLYILFGIFFLLVALQVVSYEIY